MTLSCCISAEVTLTVANVKNCLEDSVPRHMFPTLERELGVTPRDTREDSHPLTGVKLWLLCNPTASWQKLAVALYSSTLDGALRRLKELKLLSNQGNRLLFPSLVFWYRFKRNTHTLPQDFLAVLCCISEAWN